MIPRLATDAQNANLSALSTWLSYLEYLTNDQQEHFNHNIAIERFVMAKKGLWLQLQCFFWKAKSLYISHTMNNFYGTVPSWGDVICLFRCCSKLKLFHRFFTFGNIWFTVNYHTCCCKNETLISYLYWQFRFSAPSEKF